MRIVILKNSEEVSQFGADLFTTQICNKPNSVIGLATGSTPIALYKVLIERFRAKKLSFKRVTSFNLDEYLGIGQMHPQSYRYFMHRELFNHIDIEIENTHIPLGNSAYPVQASQFYEYDIKDCGGIDMQLLGIGRNGHIGFNEPASSLSSRTRVKTLTQETIADNARFFSENEFQPTMAITMGISTILDSRVVVLLATGDNKAQALKGMIEQPISAMCPASALQLHAKAIIVIDEAAASQLSNVDYYKHVEAEQHNLIARNNNVL